MIRLYLGSREGEMGEVAERKRGVFGEIGCLGTVIVGEISGRCSVRKLV